MRVAALLCLALTGCAQNLPGVQGAEEAFAPPPPDCPMIIAALESTTGHIGRVETARALKSAGATGIIALAAAGTVGPVAAAGAAAANELTINVEDDRLRAELLWHAADRRDCWS